VINELPALEEKPLTVEGVSHSIKKDLLCTDKGLLDKATQAFVSFIRYYKEHQLAFIFAFKFLDIGSVANSFFLFKLPRVREILGRRITTFTQANIYDGVRLDEVGYIDSN
jgi:hypothetical protein